MKAVIVGIANQQTALPIGQFPVEYEARRYLPGQIRHAVGGVGFNVARTLSSLGHMVALAAPLGEDYVAAMIDAECYRYSISTHLCRRELSRTPRSVVLHDDEGRRLTNVDLADAVDFVFQPEHLAPDLFKAKLVVLGNSDMVLPLIDPILANGKRLAIDLQDVRGPEDPGDQPFLNADYLNMSNERVRGTEREVLLALRERSRAKVLSITLGAEGALVLTREATEPVHVPAPAAATTRNTAGAGDVAFATFLHAHLSLKQDPVDAWAHAVGVATNYVEKLGAEGRLRRETFQQILSLEKAPDTSSSPEIAWNAFSVE